MSEGIITTRTVRVTADQRTVEIVANLDAGEIEPGMFVHIPLSGTLDVTVPIASISSLPDGALRLILDCGEDDDFANLVVGLNFEQETLHVLETGES